MKLYSTSKPSKFLSVKGCRESDIMTCRSIQRNPSHTRPWHPRRQSVFLPNWLLWWTCLSSAPRPRPGGSGRSRLASCLASCSRALRAKPDYWNAQKKDIQLRHVESLWFKPWKSNPEIQSFIQHLHQRWTMKLQHLQTIKIFCQRMSGTWHHDMPQHSRVFSKTHHTPGLGALGTNLVLMQIDVCDDRVRLQYLGQGLESATDQGWHLVRGCTIKTWSLQSHHEQFTLNWDLLNLSDSKLGKTIQKSTVSFSICIFADNLTRSKMNDETIQHLQTIQISFCQRMPGKWHHDMPQHSAEPITHQALAPSSPIWFSPKLIAVMDVFVFSASAKAWRQRQIKVGVLFGVLLEGPSGKTSLLKCSKKGHSTETCRISLIQNLEKQSRNPEFHSASTYLLTT